MYKLAEAKRQAALLPAALVHIHVAQKCGLLELSSAEDGKYSGNCSLTPGRREPLEVLPE
nr:uncharacterized protein CI109_006175 [Kwoniella shandongensis]KAA5525484.1 hypothetical protein CI109_006175 [Kwoniella shandongensis]